MSPITNTNGLTRSLNSTLGPTPLDVINMLPLFITTPARIKYNWLGPRILLTWTHCTSQRRRWLDSSGYAQGYYNETHYQYQRRRNPRHLDQRRHAIDNMCGECQYQRRHEHHHLDPNHYQSLRRNGLDSVNYELGYYYSETLLETQLPAHTLPGVTNIGTAVWSNLWPFLL